MLKSTTAGSFDIHIGNLYLLLLILNYQKKMVSNFILFYLIRIFGFMYAWSLEFITNLVYFPL